jgi:hypothetical protein
MKRFLFLLISVAGVWGCHPSKSVKHEHDLNIALIANAKTNIPSLRVLLGECPEAKVELFTKRYRVGTSMIEATCVVHNRYLFRMRMSVEPDKDKRVIATYSEPNLLVMEELEEIQLVPGSVSFQLKMRHGKTIDLSKDEWLSIIKHGGLARTGVTIVTNCSTPGIDSLKQHIRETSTLP